MRYKDSVKKSFLTGLIILLPVAITIAVVGFLINFFTSPFVSGVTAFLKDFHIADNGILFLTHEQVIVYLSKTLILICLIIVIFLLGMLTRWVLIRSILNLWDKLLHKIPVVRTVYKTTQEIIKNMFMSDKTAFKQVVLVPFPRKDMYVLGIITGNAPTACSKTMGSTLISVLIPTTPNPTTGFLLMYKPEELIHIDMKPDEAIKYIVSCGVLVPDERRLT
jgi:uncharacterized membrane protein